MPTFQWDWSNENRTIWRQRFLPTTSRKWSPTFRGSSGECRWLAAGIDSVIRVPIFVYHLMDSAFLLAVYWLPEFAATSRCVLRKLKFSSKNLSMSHAAIAENSQQACVWTCQSALIRTNQHRPSFIDKELQKHELAVCSASRSPSYSQLCQRVSLVAFPNQTQERHSREFTGWCHTFKKKKRLFELKATALETYDPCCHLSLLRFNPKIKSERNLELLLN